MENQSYSPEDSPVPAWTHYNILKNAEAKIMDELQKNNAGNDTEYFLAGLAIGYIHIPENETEGNKFSISYGYAVDCDEEENTSDAPLQQNPQTGGLDENFISKLYYKVRDSVLENAPQNSGEYLVSLEITTGHCSTLTLICSGRRCGVCSRHGQTHIQKRVNATPTTCKWMCTGSAC